MRTRVLPAGLAVAVLVTVTAARADTFDVYPGDRAITRAMAAARPGPGDTVRLHAGRYEEAIELAEGVTIAAFGDGEAVLAGHAEVVVRIEGAGVTVRGLTIEPGAGARRGVHSAYPVRIEQCRFIGLPEGVALESAPLADIVHCDFVDCAIGVRAGGASSPTVWGCRFSRGGTGVLASDGGPYIRHNLFDGVEVGLRLHSRNPHTMIVRNNVFHRCAVAGIDVQGGDFPSPYTSVRNCVFHRCGAAMTGPAAFLGGVSHCAVEACGAAPFAVTGATAAGAGAPPDTTGWSLVKAPLALTITEDGTVVIGNGDALAGRGFREPTEPSGTPGHIGLPPPFSRPGSSLPARLAPPVRFATTPLIANAVSEQYLYLAMLGVQPQRQALRLDESAGMVDALVGEREGEPVEIVFSVARFFGETSGMSP